MFPILIWQASYFYYRTAKKINPLQRARIKNSAACKSRQFSSP